MPSNSCATASPDIIWGVNLRRTPKSCPRSRRRGPRHLVPVLCYITDRSAFAGDESARRRRLLEKIAEAARCGVDYIQLREKDLSGRDLERLAREVVATVR